jgi:hypothetical protein
VRRLVTAVLVLVLLASACSVVAGGVPRHWREQVVLLYTKYGQSAEQIYDQITGVTTSDDVPMSLRTIFRISESFERYGAVLVRGDRREPRAGSPLQGHLTDLSKIVKQQHDLFLNEIQTRMHQRTSVMSAGRCWRRRSSTEATPGKSSRGWQRSEMHKNAWHSGA